MRRDSRLSRFLSVLLSVALVVSLNVPMTAFADEADGTVSDATASNTQVATPEGEEPSDGGDGVTDNTSEEATEEVKTEKKTAAKTTAVATASEEDGEAMPAAEGEGEEAEAKAVAKIGSAEYTTLADAVEKATSGATIVLVDDVILKDTLQIPAGKKIVLDLNGKTISQTKAQTAGYQMILNDGDLTIDDSSADKAGKISYTDSGNGGEYISDTIYNRAALTIENGTIENLSSGTVAQNGYPHAVDNYSGIRSASLTIDGGTIYCEKYSAVRMFCVSATYDADLVINEGAIVKGAIDMQNGTKDAAKGSLTINGGEFNTTANDNNIRFANWNGGATEYGITASIKGGVFDGGISIAYVPAAADFDSKFITAGTFKKDVSAYVEEGHSYDADTGVVSRGMVVDGICYEAVDGGVQVLDGKACSGDVVIPESIVFGGVEYAVVGVAGNAFNDANEVISVKVPNSVTTLGGAAFANMDKLKSLEIGNGVTSWGSKLAVNNSELETVVIAEGATLIGDTAFRTCPKLANVTLPSTLKTIGATAFAYSSISELNIPASVEKIGADAFKDIDTLKKVSFNSVPKSFGTTVFQQCDGLEEVVLPEGLTAIPQGTFRYCTSLKTINFPESLTEIGNYSFQGCTSLESVTISKNITNLVTNAFNGCTSLKNLVIEDGFAGTIGGYVFQGCTSLESVVIPSSMETVGESMFNMCSNLKEVTLSEGVKTLNISAFANCTSLKTITLPDSLERIRHGSFANCTALESIVILGDNLPVIEHENALDGLSEDIVVVYNGDDSFTGNWAPLANNVLNVEEGDVARVGQEGYATLAEAVSAANAIEGGATVKLLDNVTLGEKLTISGNVTISGDYAITRADSYTGTLFAVNASATLTLDGGLVVDGNNNWTLDTELYNKALNREVTGVTWAELITSEEGKPNATAPMFKVTGSVVANDVIIQNNYSSNSSNNGDYGVFQVDANATLTMTGATVKHVVTGGANSVAHLSTNSVWTINGGTLITDTFAAKNGGVCRNDSGLMVMNGGVIEKNNSLNTNGTVVMLYMGSMEMNGGRICSNTGISGEANGRCAPIYGHSTSTFVMTDGEICHNTGISYGGVDVPSSIKVEISGGYIGENISVLGNPTADVNGNANTVIFGGTFTQDVSEWCAPGYKAQENEDGTYGIVADPAYGKIAKIGETYYDTFDAAYKAAKTGDTIELLETAVITNTSPWVNYSTKKITVKAEGLDTAFRVQDGAYVWFGGMTVESDGYCVIVGASDSSSGANVEFYGGTYKGVTSAVSVTKGDVTILDGTFSVEPYEGSYEYTLNCIDAAYKNGTADISVKGGKFYNYNPMNNAAEGEGTNFLIAGYKAVEGDDGYWTVVEKDYVAKIGNKKFEFLSDALAEAQDDDVVVLMKSFELEETVKVPKKVTLDLNGKTITGTDNATNSFSLIEIQPGAELTVSDSADGGKITLTATNNRGWNAYSSVISNQRGKLTIESGVVEHLGGTDMAYGIDNLTNGKGTYAETVVNGGTVKSTYRAIRQFLNGTEAQNILTINGGSIEGTNKSVWMQDANKSANPGTLTVSDKATLKGDVYLFVTAGSTEWPVEVSIAKAALAEGAQVTSGNVPAGYEVVLADGCYVVRHGVAKIGDVYYETLKEAVEAANAIEGGATISLLKDVTLDEKLIVSGNVTISGEKTITRADDYAGTLFEVNAGAELTLDGGLVLDGGNAWTYIKTPLDMDMENGDGTYVADHITSAEGGVNATAHMIVNKGNLNVNSATVQNSYSTNGVSVIDAGASSVTVLNGALIQHVAANRSGAVAYIGGNDAVLTIKGSTKIVDNFGTGNGGIIQNYGQGTTVNLEGGEIARNHIGKSGTLYASYSGNANKINTFNMSGGLITENIMEGYGPVYIHTNTVWNMTGGEISKNTSLLPSYVRNNNPAGSITGGKIVDNVLASYGLNNGYADMLDLRLNGLTEITGGVFTQDVSKWLASGLGLSYDKESGVYSVKPMVTVTFKDQTIVEGDDLPEFTWTSDLEKIAPEGVTLNVEEPVVNVDGAGEYEITAAASISEADEYLLKVVPGKLIVQKAVVEMDGKNYASIQDAMDAAVKGTQATIKVLQDHDVDVNALQYNMAPVLVNGKDVVLDLNGKTVTFDWTTKTVATAVYTGIYLANGAKLTVVDTSEEKTGTLYDKGAIQGADGPRIIWTTSACSTVIEGGNFISEQGDTMFYTSNSNKEVPTTLYVKGGYFEHVNPTDSKGGYDYFNQQDGYQKQVIEISGGVFAKADPRKAFQNDWEITVAKGYAFEESADGKWEIVDAVATVVKADGTRRVHWDFATFEEAFAAVQDGDTLKLLKDIELPDFITVEAGKSLILDLNGKTVSGTDATSKNFGLIQNNGNLTVADSSDSKAGKIQLTATVNSGWNRYSAVISNNPGATLTVEGGHIEHLGGTDMAYGIDSLTNGGIGDVSVTINGGAVKSTYRAIRQFLNSDSKQNVLVINGGTVEGENNGVFFHDPSSKANNGIITIDENAMVNGVYLYVTEGSTEWPVNVSIADKALGEKGLKTANVPAGYHVVNVDGVHTVKTGVARIGNDYYGSLQAAINACVEGANTITLLADLSEDVTVKQAEGVNIVIDGAEKTYSGTITIHGNARYQGEETLTITGMKFATSEAGHYFIDSNSTGSVERYAHNVTVRDCKFVATGDAINSAVAMRIRQGFDIAIEGCTATDLHSVLQAYGNTGLNVSDVKILSGKNGVSVGTSTGVVVEDCEINVTGYGVRADGSGAYDMTVKGSDIAADLPIVVRNATGAYELTVGEGNELTAKGEKEYQIVFTNGDDNTREVPTGEFVLEGADGMKVFPVSDYVAKIGEKGYLTLDAAYKAANAYDTIVLLKDVMVDDKFVISKAITIDGQGHSITANPEAVWYTVSGKLNLKNYNTHLLGVNSDDVTLKDVVLDCNDNAAGINIYCAQNVVFDNVSIDKATKGFAGLTVNGSTLTVKEKLTVLGNSIAIDIDNGSGVTSDLGVTFAKGTVTNLDNKTVKFNSVAKNDVSGAVTGDGKPYFVAMDNAHYYTVAQMESRATAYSNGLTLLTDVDLNKTLKVRGTLNLGGYELTSSATSAVEASGALTIRGGVIENTSDTGSCVLVNTDNDVKMIGVDLKVNGEGQALIDMNGKRASVLIDKDSTLECGEGNLLADFDGTQTVILPDTEDVESALAKQGYDLVTPSIELEQAFAEGTAQVAICNCVAENVTTGAHYSTAAEALAEATSGDKVKMIRTSSEDPSTLIVNAGVTFDLNGCYVPAANLLSFGQVVDAAEESTGGVVISNNTKQAFVQLQKDNNMLPLYDSDEGCYRFYQYQVKNRGTYTPELGSWKAISGFAFYFDKVEAYSLVAKGDSGIKLVANLKWTGTTGFFAYTFSERTLKEYANTASSQHSSGTIKAAMTLTMTGFDSSVTDGSLVSYPTIESATGVAMAGNEYTFNYSSFTGSVIG